MEKEEEEEYNFLTEPVFLREGLHFDYTKPHPKAPLGHPFYVSLRILTLEFDFNRDVGVFQLTVEVMLINGNVTAKSSHQCMLCFRSLPKKLVHSWKWTFYVWMSLYAYIMLLVVPMCCFRPVLFPVTTSQRDHNEINLTMEVSKEPDSRVRDAREVSESLKRCITITRKDTSEFVEEDVGDSKSMC
ncbi:hypothetical protein PVL29_013565 [Vitis rotundifolia]|uniref:Seipin n=1 Tax=Vitis rotundifolia TaxID=103349 RepID=A0AA38ZLR3_VITRO|nr:hypothetical protein PVL29_013565 [Vitis rotundifolia]